MRDKPTFGAKTKLARYIDPDFRRPQKKHPKRGAYQRKLGETYLSVNSTEVESIKQIAQIYANQFEQGSRRVGIASPTVDKYNAAAKAVGINLIYHSAKQVWEFGSSKAAYTHRSFKKNKSHCGVEYVEIFEDYQDHRFAVRMSKAATYKMV